MTATVYIGHCVDTEGPLQEGLDVRFERLNERFDIGQIAPTRENLRRLEGGEIDLGGKEIAIRDLLRSHALSFVGSWPEIEVMVARAASSALRRRVIDSDDGGWVYNWFCLDHINFQYNPRRRDIGFHNIFDRYRQILAETPNTRDAIHWHFHPMSSFRDAHRCATHYFRTPEIFEILARKVIERSWFPTCYRAGFQAERPDSHWFLEQWIPFDISNMAIENNEELDKQIDFRNGRSGDWRRAPADWSVYHPSHDDYQTPGECRRWIARALNMFNRIASIDQREMDKAFARAASGQPTLVGLANHDYRDIAPEVEFVQDLVAESARRYPGVKFKFAEAREAFRAVVCPEYASESALDFELLFHPAAGGDVPYVEVKTTSGAVFGPQPFLAIETRARTFLHDNFDFSPCRRRWFYAFHGDTLAIDTVARIGVAANDRFGNLCVRNLDLTL